MRARALLAALAFIAAPLAAHAQAILYGATGGNTLSSLYTVNTATGATTAVGPMGVAVTGMSRHPTTGVMYGVTTPNSPANPTSLIRINLTTGAITVIGPLGATVAEVEFRSDGTLFGWSESSDDLVTINLTTGAATVVGVTPLGTFGDGMVFVGASLRAMLTGAAGNIYTVDQTTGATTIGVALTGSPAGGASVAAATTQPGTGVVYAALNPNWIVRVNMTTGVITTVGNTGVAPIDALAFGPLPAGVPLAAPTLSEWALILLALAMAGLGASRLRGRFPAA
jgi:hypothetical protein